MTIKEIIENYLHDLQALQMTVAKTWCDRTYFLMVVNVGHKHVKAEIFQLDELNRALDSCDCFLCEHMSADTCNERITNLNAWFGHKCVTTITGIECEICNN